MKNPSGGPLMLLRLAAKNGGVPLARLPRLAVNLLRLSINYPFVLWERWFLSRKIQNTQIESAPVFIIGHFRSGTSLMHKLLAVDPRWRHINEYELIFPHLSTQTERIVKPILQRLINFLKLKHPNFNDYPINLDDPNEDEALLISLGASWGAYWSYIFPKNWQQFSSQSIFFKNEEDKKQWKASYLFFLKRLLFKKKGHLLIKSPPHTARVAALLELFPNAKFIYMNRNQDDVKKSMNKIWRTEILPFFCLQKPDEELIQNYIQENFELLMTAFKEQKNLIPENQLIEVDYEDFTSFPKKVIERIYAQFDLSIGQIKDLLDKKIEEQKSYRESNYR